MLVIRFFRIGRKNQPSFKIVIADKRNSSTSGRFVEEVGFWNPLTKEKILQKERIKYWISVGAKPSDSIYNLLISEKIVEGKKIPKHKKPKKKETKEEKAKAEAEAVGEKPKEKKEESKEKSEQEKPKEEKEFKEKPGQKEKKTKKKGEAE